MALQKRKGANHLIPEEEILANVKEMGYVTVTPRKISPSYYKLTDGTIIKALVHINYLVPDPRQPDGYSVNSTNLVSAFVPKDKRRPEAYAPYNIAELNSAVIDEDVESEVLREEFSVYDLNNGLVLSLKTVMGQVRKTKFFTREGEPVYSVQINPVIKVKKA